MLLHPLVSNQTHKSRMGSSYPIQPLYKIPKGRLNPNPPLLYVSYASCYFNSKPTLLFFKRKINCFPSPPLPLKFVKNIHLDFKNATNK